MRRSAASLLCVLLLSANAVSTPVAEAAPPQGSQPGVVAPHALAGTTNWVVLRCAYQTIWSGAHRTQQPTSYLQTMLGPAMPNLGNYWSATSYGAISINATVIGGANEWRTLPNANAHYGATETDQNFNTLTTDCAAVWTSSVTFAPSNYYAFIVDQQAGADVGGRFGINTDGLTSVIGVLMGGGGQSDEAVWAHEMGHAFGLPHSLGLSGQPYTTAYDIMSAPSGECPFYGGGSWWGGNGNDPRTNHTTSWGCIPGQPLAYFKARLLGWIPAGRQFLGHGGTATINLERTAAPLATNDYLYAEIPVNSSLFYTVEARFKTGISTTLQTGYDENLPGSPMYQAGDSPPQGCVVINRIDVVAGVGATTTLVGGDPNSDGWYDDIGAGGSCFQAGNTWTDAAHGVTVHVNSRGTSSFNVTLTGPTAYGYDYYPLTHTRILDTTTSLGGHHGALGAGQTMTLKVLGTGGIPVGFVGAVVLNLWAVSPTATSSLTVFATGTARPPTENLQLLANRQGSNLVTVQPGTNGTISIYNKAGSTQLRADVVGYYGGPYSGYRYSPINPQTVYPISGPCVFFCSIPPGGSITLGIQGYGVLPASGVAAVALQVTSEFPTASGRLFLYPSGTAAPALNDLTYLANDEHTWLAIVKVGANGRIVVSNVGSATAQLIFGVEGWYGTQADYTYRPTTPTRVKDTRGGPSVAAGSTLALNLTGVGGIPVVRAKAVLATISDFPSGTGFLQVRPAGAGSDPNNYDVSFQYADANAVLATLGTGGVVNINNLPFSATHLAVDTSGWFGAP